MFKNSEGKYGKYIIQDLHDLILDRLSFKLCIKSFPKGFCGSITM